ncbi:MAG: RDD family protein [Burkholderiales bacterium]|nr:RDD family protein [Burkholderiales bacterium]
MQEEWWYSIGDARKGPVSLLALRQLLLEGTVAHGTLVWKEGLADWTPISGVPDLQQVVRAVPPDLPRPSTREQLIALPLAGPWRRFFARLVDLWVIALPTSFAAAFALARYSPAFSLWIQRPGSEYAFGWLLLPLILLVEVGIVAMFGTTLGKALLGVTVTTVGAQKLTAVQYLKRQVGVYWFGLGTGFPLVSLFTMARQHGRLKKGGHARGG